MSFAASFSAKSKFVSAAPMVLALLAILGGRLATHSDLAARYPAAAALLFAWLAADALALSAIAKAPGYRPGLRVLLGCIAAGFAIAVAAAAAPVREALFGMPAILAALVLTLAAYLGWSVAAAMARFRRTRSMEAALGEIVPPKLAGFLLREVSMVWLALFSWRGKPDVPQGMRGFGYHRQVNPLIATFLVLQAIEIAVVDLIVSHWSERAALVLLALGLWGALFLIALMKAFHRNPILLGERHLRVRSGSLIDESVPLAAIGGIETAIAQEALKADNVLNAAILSHPNVVLRLSEPLVHRGWLGREREVDCIAFRLDEAGEFLALLRNRIAKA